MATDVLSDCCAQQENLTDSLTHTQTHTQTDRCVETDGYVEQGEAARGAVSASAAGFRFCLKFSFFLRWVLLSLVRLFLRSFSELSGQDVFNLPYLAVSAKKRQTQLLCLFSPPNKMKPTGFDMIVVRGHVTEIDISDL